MPSPLLDRERTHWIASTALNLFFISVLYLVIEEARERMGAKGSVSIGSV